jgi:hypothetical protein
VGRFDWELAGKACNVNRPSQLAVNFMDYISYSNYGKRGRLAMSEKSGEFLSAVYAIKLCGTGPRIDDVC